MDVWLTPGKIIYLPRVRTVPRGLIAGIIQRLLKKEGRVDS